MSVRAQNQAKRVLRLFGALWARPDQQLMTLAFAIGVVTGLGALGFSFLIDGVTHFCFRTIGDRLAAAGLYLVLLPLIPMAGGLLVGLITRYFAPEAEGHGVPEVMDAMARKRGRIRPRVAGAKAVASALTIGSGGAAGTEGPIIQIGAAIGSGFGQFLRVNTKDIGVLIACGAAAGIAAIFNAPIAGVLFAVEVLLRDVSLRTFVPIIISAVMSSTVTQAFRGHNDPIFPVQAQIFGVKTEPIYDFTIPEFANYVLLGLICGLVGVAFIKTLYASEDLFRKLPLHRVLRPVLGALLLGLVAIGSQQLMGAHLPPGTDGPPAIMGNGYPVITQTLNPEAYRGTPHWLVGVLVILLVAKALGACLTLGSGGSGGVFAPSLFLGATVGGAFGLLVQQLPLFSDVSPGAYALVGMAAVVASTIHAPLTATLILFELTRDYKVVVPIMLAAVTGLAVAQWIEPASIYTLKLLRRGVDLHKGRDVSILRHLFVRDAMRNDPVTVPPGAGIMQVIAEFVEHPGNSIFVVDRDERLLGVITDDVNRAVMADATTYESFIIARDMMNEVGPLAVHPGDTLADVMKRMSRYRGEVPVVENGRLVGAIWPEDVIERYNAELFKRDMASSMVSAVSHTQRAEPIPALENTSIAEIPVPRWFVGKSLGSLDIRNRYKITVLLIKQASGIGDEMVSAVPSADYVFRSHDVMLVMGPDEKLRRLERGDTGID